MRHSFSTAAVAHRAGIDADGQVLVDEVIAAVRRAPSWEGTTGA